MASWTGSKSHQRQQFNWLVCRHRAARTVAERHQFSDHAGAENTWLGRHHHSMRGEGKFPRIALSRGLGFALLNRMTLDDISSKIKTCALQMNNRYGGMVFDEWAVVS